MNRTWLLLFALALPACHAQPGDSLGSTFFGVSGLAASENGVFFIGSTVGSEADVLFRLPLGGGAPTTLVPAGAGVESFTLDATSVYVVDAAGLQQVPQAGGAPVTLVATGALGGTPSSLIMAGTSLAWIDGTSIYLRQQQQAGTPVLPAAIPIPLPGPCALAADAANLYWLDCADRSLSSLPLSGLFSGTPPTVLATDLGLGTDQIMLPSLAAAAGSVFWSEPGSGAIREVAASGGAPVTLAPNAGQIPVQLVADGTSVYWLNEVNASVSPSSVWSVPAAGGTPTEVLTPDQNQNGGYSSIAIDGAYLYFDDNDDGSIRRLSR